jgi:predicted site-specific integrase-resolvase
MCDKPVDGDNKYLSGAAIKTTFGVSSSTLRTWADSGRVAVVRFGGAGKRLYLRTDVERMFSGYLPRTEQQKEALGAAARAKRRVLYARVSSAPQKDDLERQAHDL